MRLMVKNNKLSQNSDYKQHATIIILDDKWLKDTNLDDHEEQTIRIEVKNIDQFLTRIHF